MKLSNKVSLTASAVTVVALGVSFLAALLLVIRQETADLDRALVKQARAEAELVQRRDSEHPRVSEGGVDIPEQFGPTALYAAVYDEHGRVLSATHNLDAWLAELGPSGLGDVLHARSALNISVQGVPLRAVVVPLDGAGRRLLLFAASRHEVDADARFLVQVLGVLLLVMTALTSFAARWFGTHLARDVGELQHLASEVATGNLAARAGDRIHGSDETRALAHNLDDMIEKISELMSAQMNFVSHAAHELRSPLTTLRGELQLALHRPRTVAEYTEMIDQALADVESLIELSEDLLVLARIQAAGRTAQSCTIEDVLGEAIHANRGLAARRNVQVLSAVDGVAAGERVVGSASELARALRNLLDNAVTHSPFSSTVDVAVTRAGAWVEIAVVDRGPGVLADAPEQLFTPFFRGRTARDGGDLGAGLGLSIARAICRNAGGDVLLDPQHRPGARFVIRLPVSDAPDGLPASVS